MLQIATQLAIADAYVAVMQKATQSGFGFIAQEIADYWEPLLLEAEGTYMDRAGLLEIGFQGPASSLPPADSVRSRSLIERYLKSSR